jgi:prevent-host-death family protein
MPRTVTIHVAKTTLSQLIAQVEAGEEVVIARNKTPVAKLVPVERVRPRRQPGQWKGRISVDESFFEPLPEDELRRWEGK